MIIQSTRLGQVEVSEDHVFRVPYGLPGFLSEKLFAFIPYQPGSPFAFFQSTATPDVSFLLLEPSAFFPDYRLPLKEEDVMEFGLSQENPGQVWNIAAIPGDCFEDMTANLMAPIVLNWRDRLAVQMILENSPYSVRHRVFPVEESVEGGNDDRPKAQVASAADDREGI